MRVKQSKGSRVGNKDTYVATQSCYDRARCTNGEDLSWTSCSWSDTDEETEAESGGNGELKQAEGVSSAVAKLPETREEEGAMNEATATAQSGDMELLYGLDDVPPWYMCILLGMQHYLTMVGSTITIPFILTPLMCVDDNDPARGALISTIFFVSGVVTLLQCTFGVRLPIVQGGTFSFLVPTIAILVSGYPRCESLSLHNMTESERQEVWQVRMREVQGAIIVSSLLQVVLGFTGLVGIVVAWITPLAITPTVALVGLSLFSVAAERAALHWGVAFLTIALMVLFSQYLRNVPLPFPTYKKSGFGLTKVYVFKLFPILLAILISWAVCAILTASGVLTNGSYARTDRALGALSNAPWIRVPYPGQWGVPTVSVAAVFGMLAGVLASLIESIGDYYACARFSGAKPPPEHAINRGVGIEGIGCIIAGLWGTGNGTTSYSENIGAIGVTKVASRRVVQYGAVIMTIFSIIGKFGALFITIPEPVVGGVFCVMFSMITAVGLSNLQYVNLNSSRNLFVLGFSLFMGLAIPKWMAAQGPGIIDTGSAVADQIITVLLQTSMFIGGALGVILDNTIPGSDEERGLTKWRNQYNEDHAGEETGEETSSYDLPFVMNFVRRTKWMAYVPVSPTFTGFHRYRRFLPSGLSHRRRNDDTSNAV
ncbi:solute carrier family 23 member 1-like isoform X2 [Macrobrachium nipponense]|uniref:solute carrier family 23 member 1-like isoform X2 n=1 Tax=Macrobrachium nipponense TaxID=159736 RepID=UPI0030C7CFEF